MNAGANQDGKELIAQNVSHIGIAFTELVKILGNVFVKTGLKVKTVMLLKILTEIGVNGVLGVIVLVKENKLEKGTLKDDFVECAISRKNSFLRRCDDPKPEGDGAYCKHNFSETESYFRKCDEIPLECNITTTMPPPDPIGM